MYDFGEGINRVNIRETILGATKELKKNNVEDANIIARVLMSYILKQPKEYLIINDKEELKLKDEQEYLEDIEKIKNGYPIQYITHHQEFMKLDFYVDENVLIPQPDTEILVEETLKKCDKFNIKILDLCTGSGAIAVSLANELKKVKITASDVSEKALEIAKKNAKNNNVKIEFIHSNLFENIENKFNVIVSNPPYIESKVIEKLSKNVKCEPKLALDGGEDGLYFYRKIALEAPKFIEKNGYLIMEIGFDQKESVINILKENENYKDIEAVKDLAGNNRVICAKIV